MIDAIIFGFTMLAFTAYIYSIIICMRYWDHITFKFIISIVLIAPFSVIGFVMFSPVAAFNTIQDLALNWIKEDILNKEALAKQKRGELKILGGNDDDKPTAS